MDKIIKITLVLLKVVTFNLAYAQSVNDPLLSYGDLSLQGKIALSVEDRLGNRDTLVIGFGHNVRGTSTPFPTKNLDNNYPLELNILNNSYTNPDIRIVHSVDQQQNVALEYLLQSNYQNNYSRNAEVKFDVRSPYPESNPSDWINSLFQPYNFKISGTNFPLIVKSINYLARAVTFDFYYAASDTNGNYYTDNWEFGLMPNSSDEWTVIDTINNSAELSNYKLSGVVYNLRTNVNNKIKNSTSAYCTPERILHIPNGQSEEGEVIIYSILGKMLSSFTLSTKPKTFTLPTQTSIIIIKTQKSIWKNIY